jgi:hypothetical protein
MSQNLALSKRSENQTRPQVDEATMFGRPGRHSFHPLQTTLGNHALLRRDPGVLQAKLKISEPDDPLEREADRVAGELTRTAEGQFQDRESSSRSVNRHSSQRSSQQFMKASIREGATEDPGRGFALPTGVGSGFPWLEGRGNPLPDKERRFFERRLGVELGRVRIHANRASDRATEAINARAFACGNDIAFRRGEYNTGTRSGLKLLAHEIVHVRQQSDRAGHGIPPSDFFVQREEAARRRTSGVRGSLSRAERNFFDFLTAYESRLQTELHPNSFAKWFLDNRSLLTRRSNNFFVPMAAGTLGGEGSRGFYLDGEMSTPEYAQAITVMNTPSSPGQRNTGDFNFFRRQHRQVQQAVSYWDARLKSTHYQQAVDYGAGVTALSEFVNSDEWNAFVLLIHCLRPPYITIPATLSNDEYWIAQVNRVECSRHPPQQTSGCWGCSVGAGRRTGSPLIHLLGL